MTEEYLRQMASAAAFSQVKACHMLRWGSSVCRVVGLLGWQV